MSKKMTSRERVLAALNHQEPDRIPFDLGSTNATGIHAVEQYTIREKLGLKKIIPKVLDPMMFFSEVDEDLRQALGADLVGIFTKGTLLGYRNENWKIWTLPDGSEAYMGEGFTYTLDENGTVYAYAKGDTNYPPSVMMAKTGLYFDNITRQEDLDKKEVWDAREDYKDQYAPYSEQDLKYISEQVDYYWNNTEYALVGNYGSGSIGSPLNMPGPHLKEPKGIRDFSEWMMAMLIRPEYIKEAFDMHTELSIENMKSYYEAAGNKISVMLHTGTDFGSQKGLLISTDTYRELFQPYHKRVNDWIHNNTEWKTLIHTCGAVYDLIPDLIDAGFDCLNPVQVSATGMEAERLKSGFGDKIVFWGGGVDPQDVLINATPEEVYSETKSNAAILSKDGGYIGANVHNLQYNVPAENFLAEANAIKDARVNE